MGLSSLFTTQVCIISIELGTFFASCDICQEGKITFISSQQPYGQELSVREHAFSQTEVDTLAS